MKPNQQRRRVGRSPASPDTGATGATAVVPPALRPGRRWRWGFRLLAAALPFGLLLLLEAALRLVGYGYPTGFLLKSQIDGQEVFIENQKFGWRFFPRPMARSPRPQAIPVPKPPGTYRIVVLGESAAMGDPEPAFGFARMIEVLLRERYPGMSFEVINAGMTAINSHVVVEIARDCRPLQADLWLIYLGNNEVVGPFGAGTVFGARAPARPLLRWHLWSQSTRLGQWLAAARERLDGAAAQRRVWGGMEMFLDCQVRAEDPHLQVVYRHFQDNLRDLIRLGRQAGARVVVSTVVGNLKDCAPFASQHRLVLSASERAAWTAHYQAGMAAEQAAQTNEALAQYEQALRLDSQYADLHFRLGRIYQQLEAAHPRQGYEARARHHFQQACDADTLRFRPDTSLLEGIRQVAREFSEGVVLVDAQAQFASPQPPGWEALWEHVHLNFAGNYRLARLLAEAVARQLPSAVAGTGRVDTSWLAFEPTAERLALCDWTRYQTVEQVKKRLELPPFNHQLNHTEQLRLLDEDLARLRPATTPAGWPKMRETFGRALAQSPRDWMVREKFAQYLEAAHDLPGALEQWQQVAQRLPHYAQAHYQMGNLLDKQGRSEAALGLFATALKLKPDSVEAWNGLGLCLFNLNRWPEALDRLETALRLKPDFAAAHVNLALTLSRLGRTAEAKAHYGEAIRLQTNSPAAFINLGKLFSQERHFEAALTNYLAAAQISPADPIPHYNLGNTLAALERYPEARTHYQRAVDLQPDFAEARVGLGLEMARAGDTAGALAHFAEAVRLKPGEVEARFNLGVALAKLRRFAEAREQFQAAVRLKPEHARAHLNLGRLLAQQREFEAALVHLREGLRLEPANPEAQQLLEQALRMKTQGP